LVVDDTLLADHGITQLGFTEVMVPEDPSNATGTYAYMAPEILEGKAATIQADLYALGVLLYQMAFGDLTHPLAPGWRRDIADPILAEDIAQIVDGSPERRPASASEIAERLRGLEERQAHRRRKLFVAFGGVATAVLLVVSFLAIQAVQARRDAEVSRGQAEDLIGFMLGDLRSKLEPVGRLDILDDIGERAIAYFKTLPEGDLTNEDLFRRSTALNQIGEVRIQQGDLTSAMEAFQESLSLAEALVERNPDNDRWALGSGTTHFWIGHVHWLRRDLDRAIDHFREYLAVTSLLAKADVNNQKWKQELSYAHGNVGTILQEQGKRQAALAHFKSSLLLKQALVEAAPTNAARRFDLSNALNKVGWLQESIGELDQALEHYIEDISIKGSLVRENPTQTHWRYRLAVSHTFAAALLEARGVPSDALSHFRTTIKLLDELVSLDPTNLSWLRELAFAHGGLGDTLRNRGLEGCWDPLRTRIAILQDLVARDSSVVAWQRDLGLGHHGLALALQADGQHDKAWETGQEAIAVLEPVAEKNPTDQDAYRLLGESYSLIGTLWEERGDSPRARLWWQRAANALEPWAEHSEDRLLLFPWVEVLLHLDREDAAIEVLNRLRARGYGAASRFTKLEDTLESIR